MIERLGNTTSHTNHCKTQTKINYSTNRQNNKTLWGSCDTQKSSEWRGEKTAGPLQAAWPCFYIKILHVYVYIYIYTYHCVNCKGPVSAILGSLEFFSGFKIVSEASSLYGARSHARRHCLCHEGEGCRFCLGMDGEKIGKLFSLPIS